MCEMLEEESEVLDFLNICEFMSMVSYLESLNTGSLELLSCLDRVTFGIVRRGNVHSFVFSFVLE